MNNIIKLAIYYADQCDKKKCTSIKIQSQIQKLPLKLYWLTNPKLIKQNSIVLTPNSDVYLTNKDKIQIEKVGITILDCSWKQGQKYLKEWFFKNGRILPPLLAGNPVNYGKWHKLSSAEALSAAFYIIGFPEMALNVLSLFNWGQSFFDLNINLLSEYAGCISQEDVKKVIKQFL